ncbi:MAG: hypothetical protein LC802_16610 [Acidobacteria bacterium]|nr:hypothetical protein [Acidobacteriota bacterium]
MAIFTIPEEYELGLAEIFTLSDDSVQKILTALEGIAPSIRYKSIAERVASNVHDISKEVLEALEDIFEVLFSLNIIRTGAEVPTDIFVDDICEAVSESGSELLKEAAGVCGRFKPNLIKLLESKTLEIASKSGMLLRESGQTYCSARILSDLRPVFSESVEDAPMAAMTVHTLKLTYHQGDRLKDFFLAMNTKDVQRLRELLDRADAKAASLRTLANASKMIYVDAE